MGQARAQSQQRAQCAGRPAAAPATQLTAMAAIVRRPDGGWLGGNSGRGYQAGLADADPSGTNAAAAAPSQHHLRADAGTDDEDRSRGAVVDVGRSETRPAHRDRLSAGRHHRDSRAPWAGGAAVAPDRGTDPAGRARGQGLARPDAGADSRCELIGSASAAWPRLAPVQHRSNRRSREMRMKRTGLALMAVVLAGPASLTPAQAVPPTATPSPGYDARLQEQRAAQ